MMPDGKPLDATYDQEEVDRQLERLRVARERADQAIGDELATGLSDTGFRRTGKEFVYTLNQGTFAVTVTIHIDYASVEELLCTMTIVTSVDGEPQDQSTVGTTQAELGLDDATYAMRQIARNLERIAQGTDGFRGVIGEIFRVQEAEVPADFITFRDATSASSRTDPPSQ
jgi:hypothetical protein